jgi:CheY-like chemotaxis protein
VKVLVAEDNGFNYEVLAEFLGEGSHEVSWAQDGEEALAMARTYAFDVLLLDVHMPRLDGLHVLRALRADPSTAATKVIMLTADAMLGIRQELAAAGADGLLTKPIDLTLLGREIDRVTGAGHSYATLDSPLNPPARQ